MAIMGPDLQGILFLHARPQKDPWGGLSLLDQLANQVQFIPATGSSPSP